MKITTKTTKEQLKTFLGLNANAVKEQDKDLFDRLVYADKMLKKDESKVQRKDLVDLVKEVIEVLGDKCVELMTPAQATPVAENSVKKLQKGVAKKQETKTDDSEESGESDETDEDEEETPAETKKEAKVDSKSAKKSLGKKKEQPKKDGVTTLAPTTTSDKAVQLAEAFPKTLVVGNSKYELAEDIKTFDDLYDAVSNDEEIVFAYYWTKRHLKQFPYFGGWLGQPKSFDNDLDLATAMYVSDEKVVCYQVSTYTEAVYTILPSDFEVVDGVRIAGGIEYQIYRAV